MFVAIATAASQLTSQEKVGKRIYLRGSSPSGQEIIALMGDGASEVPASVLPCVNCHGYDGRGRPEGGVTPSNITWEALTKTYGVTHESGRKHPPYTPALLERAIQDGIDPAQNKLLAAMPRYRMSRENLEALVAYMKRLGRDADPGVTETGVRVGTVVPAVGPRAETGRELKELFEAYFDDINRQGGIYDRKIELRVAEAVEPAAETANFKHLISEEGVFALVGGFTTGADWEIESLIESEEVPAVGLLTAFPQTSFPVNRYLFYVLPGLKQQALALVDFARENLHVQSPRVAVAFPQTEMLRGLPEAVAERCKASGWGAATQVPYARDQFDAAQLVTTLRQQGTNVVFFLGFGPEASAFAKEAAELDWKPNILLLGSLAGREVFQSPPDFKDKIFVAFPALPSDQTPDGVEEFRQFLVRHKLSLRSPALQIWAYCAAKIFVQGLRLAGRELTREKLVSALEGLYEFDTGLIPPITYGPDRRIGCQGAYVVGVDLERKRFVPLSAWIAVIS